MGERPPPGAGAAGRLPYDPPFNLLSDSSTHLPGRFFCEGDRNHLFWSVPVVAQDLQEALDQNRGFSRACSGCQGDVGGEIKRRPLGLVQLPL